MPNHDRAKQRMHQALPPYTVRESRRAKHVRFQVSVPDGLVVVIPEGFDRRRIPELIDGKRRWIERALKTVEEQRAVRGPLDERPEAIELQAIGRTWRLDWRETPLRRIAVHDVEPGVLLMAGPIGDREEWKTALRRWLIERGREHLIPWTERLETNLGVSHSRISIRCQKTRWGSYSTKTGRINLNAQLLFLPKHLAQFVMLHELCHVTYPDHSVQFWDLVRQTEPETDRLRMELRAAWRYVPPWVMHPYRPAM